MKNENTITNQELYHFLWVDWDKSENEGNIIQIEQIWAKVKEKKTFYILLLIIIVDWNEPKYEVV